LYYYEVFDQECHIVLQHEKKFKQSEFNQMCKQSPKVHLYRKLHCYDTFLVSEYLKENFGFKAMEYDGKFVCK
jgi:hypothetical protein